jgi:hypothetical protein
MIPAFVARLASRDETARLAIPAPTSSSRASWAILDIEQSVPIRYNPPMFS